MSCLNCNRETAGTQVFCDQCLQAMEDYPVQRGTPVIIPTQPSPTPVKKQATHWHASAEEQLAAAQRANRRMAFGLITMSLLLILAAAVLIYLALSGGAQPVLFKAAGI